VAGRGCAFFTSRPQTLAVGGIITAATQPTTQQQRSAANGCGRKLVIMTLLPLGLLAVWFLFLFFTKLKK
jgi:hypothetical protein